MINVYVYEQGSRLKIKENRICIETENLKREIPINSVENIILFGRIEVTSALVRTCVQNGIALTWLSTRGRFFGRLQSTSHVNVLRQKKQILLGANEKFALEIAKIMVEAKTNNQLVLLKRKSSGENNRIFEATISEIERTRKRISSATSLSSLLGYEGNISKAYFKGLSLCVSEEFQFKGRSKRPPKDAFNSMISFAYTILLYEIYSNVCNRGLHPYFAFLHKDKYNHPALCSDLMEEWRAILADALAVKLINKRQVEIADFVKNEEDEGILMSKKAINILVKTFEENMKKSVTYLVPGKKTATYRRAIEYQVLSLAMAIDNEDPKLYSPILSR